jgi:hypothetical protein
MTPANRPARPGEVQTVLGPIDPDDLGPTLMHEHLLCDIRHPSQRTEDALGPELALDNVWASMSTRAATPTSPRRSPTSSASRAAEWTG